ncbi:MAG: LytTR family DNA-binding domain-containing protein, partial [Hyphococcus sp.]
RGRDFALLIAAGVFMAAIGAFDTDGAAIGRRALYWVTLMTAGGVVHHLLEPRVATVAFVGGVWSKGALLAGLMTLLLTPVVWIVSALVFGAALAPDRLAQLIPGVLVVNAALVALLGVTQHRTKAQALPAAGEDLSDVIRDRLPLSLRKASLIALQSEDHYVRVHTDAGAALIRINLRDAIAALDPAQGFQTHRSWWVSEAAIRDIRWKHGRATLRLDNGVEAPVSRTFAKRLVETRRL